MTTIGISWLSSAVFWFGFLLFFHFANVQLVNNKLENEFEVTHPGNVSSFSSWLVMLTLLIVILIGLLLTLLSLGCMQIGKSSEVSCPREKIARWASAAQRGMWQAFSCQTGYLPNTLSLWHCVNENCVNWCNAFTMSLCQLVAECYRLCENYPGEKQAIVMSITSSGRPPCE